MGYESFQRPIIAVLVGIGAALGLGLAGLGWVVYRVVSDHVTVH